MKTLLQKKFDLSEFSRQDIRGDRELLLKDKAENSYTLFISAEGNWSLTDNLYTPVQPSSAVQETLVNKAKSVMDELSLLPQDVAFTALDNGVFQWTLPDRAESNQDYWLGDVDLGLKPDGSVYALSYSLHQHQLIREVNILSPAEVYERIKNGDFPQIKFNALVTDEELLIKTGDQLTIDLIELSYMYDTKGFYQPIYRVSGTFNKKAGSP